MLKLYMKAHNLLLPLNDDSGQDMIEYAIMLGVIAVAVIGFVTTVGGYVTSTWSALAASL
jgi:Flp pilus assembly pilin Flp